MKLNKFELVEQLSAEIKDQVSVITNHFLKSEDHVMQKAAENGGWSVVQCLDHLNSYGNYYLPRIHAALQRAEKNSSPVYKSGWLGDYFTRIMSPETGVKKHKAFKDHIPEAHLNTHAVISEFLHQENLLLSYLETAKDLDLSVRIPISISKWVTLKLGDIFRFVIIHNRRHILQAERNLKS